MIKKLIPSLLLLVLCGVFFGIQMKFSNDLDAVYDKVGMCIGEHCPYKETKDDLRSKRNMTGYASITFGFLAVAWFFGVIISSIYKRHLEPGLELRRLRALKEIEELKNKAG